MENGRKMSQLKSPHGDRRKPIRIAEIARPAMLTTDSDGIPQLSDRHPDTPKNIDFKYASCPFTNSPSRYPNGVPHEKPISELERQRLAENYLEILAITGVVRDAYLRSHGKDPETNGSLTVGEAKEVIMGLSYIPQYLINRAVNPFKPQGEIPVVYIALSNSASGAHGAVNAQFIAEGQTEAALGSAPDVDLMIDLVEKEGALVGPKTVCVASPLQMKNYINAIIDGPEDKAKTTEITPAFDVSEVPSIIKFGKGMYEGRNLLDEIKGIDTKFVERVSPLMRSRDIPHIKEAIAMFKMHIIVSMVELNQSQRDVDQALGRETASPATLEVLTSILKLGMPLIESEVARAESKRNRRKLVR